MKAEEVIEYAIERIAKHRSSNAAEEAAGNDYMAGYHNAAKNTWLTIHRLLIVDYPPKKGNSNDQPTEPT